MFCKSIAASLLLLVGLSVIVKAQPTPDYPSDWNVIGISKVSDAIEGGTNGQFRIFKSHTAINEEIVINYTVTGTATNPADYNFLGLSTGNRIVIPANAADIYRCRRSQ